VNGTAFNEVYPGGAILKTSYGPPPTLLLWHWAYRRGEPIELVRAKNSSVLELAHEYWAVRLNSGLMPPVLVDAHGQNWERQWERLQPEPV